MTKKTACLYTHYIFKKLQIEIRFWEDLMILFDNFGVEKCQPQPQIIIERAASKLIMIIRIEEFGCNFHLSFWEFLKLSKMRISLTRMRTLTVWLGLT